MVAHRRAPRTRFRHAALARELLIAATAVATASIARADPADEASPPGRWTDRLGGSFGWTSEKVYRGIGQSDGKPALLASADARADGGWSVGAAVSLLAGGRIGDASVSLGRAFRLAGGWSLRASVERDLYPGERRRRAYDHDEMACSALYADRWAAELIVSPNTTVRDAGGRVVRGWATALQVGVHQRLVDRWALDVGVGRADSLVGGGGYRYGSAGVSSGLGPAQGFLVYVVGPHASGTSYGPTPGGGNRWTASVLWSY